MVTTAHLASCNCISEEKRALEIRRQEIINVLIHGYKALDLRILWP